MFFYVFPREIEEEGVVYQILMPASYGIKTSLIGYSFLNIISNYMWTHDKRMFYKM